MLVPSFPKFSLASDPSREMGLSPISRPEAQDVPRWLPLGQSQKEDLTTQTHMSTMNQLILERSKREALSCAFKERKAEMEPRKRKQGPGCWQKSFLLSTTSQAMVFSARQRRKVNTSFVCSTSQMSIPPISRDTLKSPNLRVALVKGSGFHSFLPGDLKLDVTLPSLRGPSLRSGS